MSIDVDTSIQELLAQARWIVAQPEKEFGACDGEGSKNFAPGFIGYADTPPGAKVLLATDSHNDPAIAEALATALREKGASVDVLVLDAGPDRPIEEDDELRAMIRRTSWKDDPRYEPRRYNDVPWITELLKQGGYDLFIQGRAYTFWQPCRWEGYPWSQAEQFLSEANTFPRDLHILINEKSWAQVWESGGGTRVHVTDPEGTDFSWTLLPEYWTSDTGGFEMEPTMCHHMYHPAPPISPTEDATGVVAGTLAHFSRPFPLIKVHVENGRVERVEGGGGYGDAWRALKAETDEIQYEGFPRPGLFWFWEAALGTNPKVRRPVDVTTLATGATEWERFRAGVLHLGFGTGGPSDEEEWAGRHGHPYGHLHVHLQFPTVDLIRPDGTTIRTVERGRLTVLDDPEIREAAARYGDPVELLDTMWEPPIPGVSIPGDFEVYAKDPARWFFGHAD